MQKLLARPHAGMWILMGTMIFDTIAIAVMIGIAIIAPDTWVMRSIAVALNAIVIGGISFLFAAAVLGYRFLNVPLE